MSEADGRRMFELVKSLAFSRVAGDPGEFMAAETLVKRAMELRLDPRMQRFHVSRSIARSHSIETIEPEPFAMDSRPLAFSGSTPEGGITAPLVFVEAGARQDIARARGAIALLFGAQIEADVWRGLKEAGALGFVAIAHPGRGVPYFGVSPYLTARHGDLPGVAISFDDGVRLVRSQRPIVKLAVSEVRQTGESQNVVVRIRGSEKPDELVVIGAHYDSVRAGHGVQDNLAGVSAVWEIMRLMAGRRPARSVEFVAFGAEEDGCFGSLEYVKRSRPLLMVNFDVGGGIIGQDSALVTSEKLRDEIHRHSESSGTGLDATTRLYDGDDIPFTAMGVPSVTFCRTSGTSFYIHSERDLLDWIDEVHLERWVSRALPLVENWTGGGDISGCEIDARVAEEAIEMMNEYFEMDDAAVRRLRGSPGE